MDLIDANINNLTTLWKTGGKLAGFYNEYKRYSLSISETGEWPNRLWFNEALEEPLIKTIQKKWNLSKVSVPIWGENMEQKASILKSAGFKERHSQVAMSRSLMQVAVPSERVVMSQVKSEPEAAIWSKLFEEAFGYEISANTVSRTMDFIAYFIGEHHGIPIGTVMLFMDKQGVAGIHSIGILPAQRRKGFAEEILIHILHAAKLAGASYATLQASEMGMGLYAKMGFQKDFQIKTYFKP